MSSQYSVLFIHPTRQPTAPLRSLAFLIAVLAVSWSAAQEVDRMEIVPDDSVQAVIARLADCKDRAERQAAFERIAAVNDVSSEQFVRQLAYFAARAKDTRQSMIVGAVVRRLEIADETTARALAPYLETSDAEVAKSVRGILIGIERRSADRRPDFSVYRGILEDCVRNRRDFPMPLVRYMFEADAGMAMMTMMRAQQLREPEQIKRILWAERTVSDVLWKQKFGFLKPSEVDVAADEQLTVLATHEAWWARLYVAEIMRQQPAFRRTEVLTALAGDSNESIRASAAKALPVRAEPAKAP